MAGIDHHLADGLQLAGSEVPRRLVPVQSVENAQCQADDSDLGCLAPVLAVVPLGVMEVGDGELGNGQSRTVNAVHRVLLQPVRDYLGVAVAALRAAVRPQVDHPAVDADTSLSAGMSSVFRGSRTSGHRSTSRQMWTVDGQ